MFVIVTTEHYNSFFDSIREVLIDLVYPGQDPPAATISAANWRIFCRYMMKSRIDTIYSSFTGIRSNGRIPMPRNVALPRALATIINSIGIVTVRQGALVVVPQPEPAPNDANAGLNNLFTATISATATNLIAAAHSRNFIGITTLVSVPEGTTYWLLTVRNIASPDDVAQGNASSIDVYSHFREFTPADALLAALVQNRFNGTIDTTNQAVWKFGPVTASLSIRHQFIRSE